MTGGGTLTIAGRRCF